MRRALVDQVVNSQLVAQKQQPQTPFRIGATLVATLGPDWELQVLGQCCCSGRRILGPQQETQWGTLLRSDARMSNGTGLSILPMNTAGTKDSLRDQWMAS